MTLLSVIGALIVLGFVATFAGLSTWVERKVSARIQSRHGPMYAGPQGILQFAVDGVKLLFKEDIIPAAADRILFSIAPYIVFMSAFAMFAALPWSRGLTCADLNIGVVYVIAVGGGGVIGILMAGWSSGNKYALFGAMRAAAQIVSYEVPAAIVLLTVVMIAGSLGMQDIVKSQEGGVHHWMIFQYFPFNAIGFILYYICALAETNRTPFDIPEAESELVAGYHVEYSGMRFSVFFMGEYAAMFATSAIATTLFLGGWQPPYPGLFLPDALGVLEGLVWFMLKALTLVLVMIIIRWTVPRFRVDQLMNLCWKVLLPVALFDMMAVGTWMSLEMGLVDFLRAATQGA